MSSGETGMEVAAGVGPGFGTEVAVSVGREAGAAVLAGVGEGMIATTVETGAGPDGAVEAGGEDRAAIFETAVGAWTTFGVEEGALRCTDRCGGSALGCEHAMAPIANISKA